MRISDIDEGTSERIHLFLLEEVKEIYEHEDDPVFRFVSRFITVSNWRRLRSTLHVVMYLSV